MMMLIVTEARSSSISCSATTTLRIWSTAFVPEPLPNFNLSAPTR